MSEEAEPQASLADLRRDNDTLRARVAELEAAQSARQARGRRFVGWLGLLGLRLSHGKDVSDQTRRTLHEVADWRPGRPVPRDALLDLAAATLSSWARTRAWVVVGLVIGAVPTYFLWRQTRLMEAQSHLMREQTALLATQNETVQRQTALLDEQTRHTATQTAALQQQNLLLAFEQTSRFRGLLKDGVTHGKTHAPVVMHLSSLGNADPETVIPALVPLVYDPDEVVRQGALEVLGWCPQHLKRINLSKAAMQGAWLGNADLTGARLIETDLRGGDLIGTTLTDADLLGINLTGADLSMAHLIQTNLEAACMVAANLSLADVAGANLKRADLRGARLLSVENWTRIASVQGANIWGIVDAPEGFREWALAHGAVEDADAEPKIHGCEVR